MKYNRIMGLDYGAKTVGVAISDELNLTAQPRETIFRDKENKLRRTLSRLVELIREYNVDLIVLGLPINMDATYGERAASSLRFRDLLKARLEKEFESSIEIKLVDERLTTKEADEILALGRIPKTDRKAYLDQIAASLILEDYMKHQKEIDI